MRLDDLNNSLIIWGKLSEEGLEYILAFGKVVILPEIRPSLLGLNNRELLDKSNVSYVCCTDNMVGMLFYKKKIQEVLIFGQKEKDNLKSIGGLSYIWHLAKIHGVRVKLFLNDDLDLDIFKDKDASTINGKLVTLDAQGPVALNKEFEIIKFKE